MPTDDLTDLQFDQAEFDQPQGAPAAGVSCGSCARDIPDFYYEAGGQVVCEGCIAELDEFLYGGSPVARLVRALLFGIPAGALGTGIYYGILALTGWEIGLVAIVIGFMVGKAVAAGANQRGGMGYQLLAVSITYTAIVCSYIPVIQRELAKANMEMHPIDQVFLAFQAPFIGGFENIIGIAIIAFGLYQAWVMNQRLEVVITGPHALGGGPPADAVSA